MSQSENNLEARIDEITQQLELLKNSVSILEQPKIEKTDNELLEILRVRGSWNYAIPLRVNVADPTHTPRTREEQLYLRTNCTDTKLFVYVGSWKSTTLT